MARRHVVARALVLAALSCAATARAQEDAGPIDDAGPAQEDGPAALLVDGAVRAAPGAVADPSLPTVPDVYSFKSVEKLSGRVGTSLAWIGVQPYGFQTGYWQLFTNGDYEDIADTGLGLHWDLDFRMNALEPRQPCILALDDPNTPVNERAQNAYDLNADGTCDLTDLGVDAAFYRNVGVLPTGRHNDWLRVDRLAMTWSNDVFGVGVGRMLVDTAAQAPVDGVDATFGFGSLGRVGAFAGFRPNPWHPQVIGAMAGGAQLNEQGDYVPPVWGTTTRQGQFTFGPYGQEQVDVPGAPWLRVMTLRFLTAGGYTSLRLGPVTTDLAVVSDLYHSGDFSDLGIDRVWAFTSGTLRIIENMTLAWRSTVDLVGARPLLPSQAFVDWSWRDLGPVSLSATYVKINTAATALSFARFYRPLEDPDGVLIDQAKWDGLFPPGSRQSFLGAVAVSGVDNAAVFVVDRDRFLAEVAVEIGPSLQVYGEGQFERRADKVYSLFDAAKSYGDVGAGWTRYADLFKCSYADDDPNRPLGINPTVPVWQDLCRLGGTLGLRDPFLAGAGNFDLSLTHLNGYASSTTRLQGRLGVTLTEVLYLEAGGAFEKNTAERVYTGDLGVVEPGTAVPQEARFLPRELNVYLVDGVASWTIWNGLALELSAMAFVEDIPFQGDTNPGGQQASVAPRDHRQLYFVTFSRGVWRF